MVIPEKPGCGQGKEIRKSSDRVEAYGTVDELNSFLGDARHGGMSRDVDEVVVMLQRYLFQVGGMLADMSNAYSDPLDPVRVDEITSIVHRFEEIVQVKGFVVPGQTPVSARLDICRVLARRCERRVVAIDDGHNVPAYLLAFINRVSDLLFVLARYEEHLVGKLLYKNDVPLQEK
jgi:cob(I)alamin adenosyltransferase